MISARIFDVLVVYTSSIALSPNRATDADTGPFTKASGRFSYNEVYGYFMEACQNIGLKAAFCTSSDIVGAGTCSTYWQYEHGTWNSVRERCYAPQIFDKFSPLTKQKKLERALLFSSELIEPFNNPELVALFFDKLATYESLTKYTIPSVSLNDTSTGGIKKSLTRLRSLVSKHLHSDDFSGAVILKDRFGAGGHKIYKITQNFVQSIYDLLVKNPTSWFILQPFLQFERGYSFHNRRTNTDIRLIYHNGNIIQTYIRLAKKDDFRCNEHQGGELIYTQLADIPKKVLQFSDRVARTLGFNSSLFALDYVVSDNGNVYFLEGNSGPGIDWNPNKKKNELMSKELIETIAHELLQRSQKTRIKVPVQSTTFLPHVSGYTIA